MSTSCLLKTLKITEKIIGENTFKHKKKKPGLNLTSGEALIGLRTTGPDVSSVERYRECSLSVIGLKSLKQKAFKPRKKTEDAPRNVWFSFQRAFWKILTISRLILIYKFCISLHWFLSLSLSGARSSHTHRPDFPNFLSVSNILNLAYHHEKRPYLHICKPVAARTPEIWSFFRPVKKSKRSIY